jgi:hypothetical protein
MKYFRVNFVFLCVIFSSIIVGSLSASQEELFNESIDHKNCLCFYLNIARQIKRCNSFGTMSYYESQSQFIGKDVLTVLPLPDWSIEKIESAFEYAVSNNVITPALYKIDEKNFIAYIYPLLNGENDFKGFFVQVYQQHFHETV